MLMKYIEVAMEHAKYEQLEEGNYYGEIPPLKGVWADGQTLERCRETLMEVLEDWLILKLRDNDALPAQIIHRREHKESFYQEARKP